MPILMVHEVSGGTIAQYDQVIRELEAGGNGNPLGRLSHVAAPTEDGYLVVDAWESQEALDRFAQTLGPLLERAGGPAPPPRVYPVHNAIPRA